MNPCAKADRRKPSVEAQRDSVRPGTQSARQRGSVLVIVMWIAFGLVSLALYFANSMNLELHASDNRVSGMAADQAIEGAARYLNYLLTTQIANGSNGVFLSLDTLSMPGRSGRRGPLLADRTGHE